MFIISNNFSFLASLFCVYTTFSLVSIYLFFLTRQCLYAIRRFNLFIYVRGSRTFSTAYRHRHHHHLSLYLSLLHPTCTTFNLLTHPYLISRLTLS